MSEYEVWFDTGDVHISLRPTIKAKTKAAAKSKALAILKDAGWSFVNDEAIVTTVEQVYETRWDCTNMPDRVRLAA